MALGVPDRLVVRQDATEGIALSVNGEVLIYLKASFHCTWDRSNEYLTVEKSGISVFGVKPSGQPIIRYEYERDARAVPASCGNQPAYIRLTTRRENTLVQAFPAPSANAEAGASTGQWKPPLHSAP